MISITKNINGLPVTFRVKNCEVETPDTKRIDVVGNGDYMISRGWVDALETARELAREAAEARTA